MRHPACRLGFVAGFMAGIVLVAGLSRSDGLEHRHAVAVGPSSIPAEQTLGR